MSKHTPGPWRIELAGEQSWKLEPHSSGENRRWNVIDGAGDWVAGYLPTDRARLIAAAPELLKACQAARAIFAALMAATHKSPGPSLKEIDAAFRRLEALLGRIEGGEL